jgi:hypothetical protein
MSVFDSLKNFPLDENYEVLSDWCSGKRNRFYGMKHTDESKLAMSETLKQQFVNGRVTHNKGKYAPDDEVGYSGLYMRNYRKGIKKIDKNRIYITPKGESITITDLKEYCKEYKLTYQSMLKLHRGLVKQHKGYRKAPFASETQ